MNFYKLSRKLRDVVEQLEEYFGIADVQLNYNHNHKWYKEYMEAKNALKYLKPLMDMVDGSALEDVDEHYYKLSNNRICIFRTNLGNVKYALYTDKAAASDSWVKNDHYALGNVIERTCATNDEGVYTEYIHGSERWCGFYDVLCGNREKVTMILYGVSDTYPINIKDYKLLEEFLKLINEEHKFGKIERLVVQSLEDKEKFITITL